MSVAAIPALAPRSSRRHHRQRWGKRPDTLSPNSHWPRYCTHVQDALVRRPGVRALYDLMYDRADKLDGARRILRNVSLSMLMLWLGDALRALNPGESRTAAEPVPRSTVCYWLRQLMRLYLIQPWDVTENHAAAARYRGDGRHKTTWIIHSYDRALDLLAADPGVATPKNRTFWTLDGRPLSTDEAVDWTLDALMAERMPEAWANNARFYDPNAPMKPIARTLRPATASEIDAILTELTDTWQIATTRKQAAEILDWARRERTEIQADGLAGAIRQALIAETARQRKREKYRQVTFTIAWLTPERVRGIANLWHAEELRRRAIEATNARIAAEWAVRANPPPDSDTG